MTVKLLTNIKIGGLDYLAGGTFTGPSVAYEDELVQRNAAVWVGTDPTTSNNMPANVGIDPVTGRIGISVSGPFDVIVYGATPGGVMAACAAAKAGASVGLFEPSNIVGGMLSGGLAVTDVDPTQSSHVIYGATKDFFEEVAAEYNLTWQQFYRLHINGTPRVYAQVIQRWLSRYGVNVFTGQRLVSVNKSGTTIASIQTTSTMASAKQFIDASYEGDLLAAAGCTTTIGREGSASYGEAWCGVRPYAGAPNQFADGIDPYVIAGNSGSGLIAGVESGTYGSTGDPSGRVMAMNYRMTMTTQPSKRITIPQPTSYDATQYELLGRHAVASGAGWTSFGNVALTSALQGTLTYDVNNSGAFSTNYIGPECTEYITASADRRAAIAAQIKDYTLGLFKFLATDSRIPSALRTDMANWGFRSDEFEAFGGFSSTLYVREGRRLVGDWVMKEPDVNATTSYTDGVAFIYYPLDSHHCRRLYVPAVGVKNEGAVSTTCFVGNAVPIRVMFPKVTECTNLLATFAVSASHVAFMTLRMEPVSMELGNAAGVTATLAAKQGCNVQSVPVSDVQRLVNWQGNQVTKPGGVLMSVDGTTYTGGTITETGAWGVGNPVLGYLGYAHKASSATGASEKFAPNLAKSGQYQVFLNWQDPQASTRSQNSVVTIVHAGGTTTFKVNQMADGDGGNWFNAGQYAFEKGSPSAHYVTIGTDGAGGSTVIAAVKFVPV